TFGRFLLRVVGVGLQLLAEVLRFDDHPRRVVERDGFSEPRARRRTRTLRRRGRRVSRRPFCRPLSASRDAQGADRPDHQNESERGSHKAMPSSWKRKVSSSPTSSISLLVGFPAPWPALLSSRSRIGRSVAADCASCKRAVILRACRGSTRVS